MGRTWLLLGAILGALSVAIGAFGAHALESHLKKRLANGGGSPERAMDIWDTGARYQMYHALALLGVGLLVDRSSGPQDRRRRRFLNVAGACFAIGTLAFSGSLYVLVLTKIGTAAIITPIGGLILLVGWMALAGAAIMRASP